MRHVVAARRDARRQAEPPLDAALRPLARSSPPFASDAFAMPGAEHRLKSMMYRPSRNPHWGEEDRRRSLARRKRALERLEEGRPREATADGRRPAPRSIEAPARAR
jgi:hypothetical protein